MNSRASDPQFLLGCLAMQGLVRRLLGDTLPLEQLRAIENLGPRDASAYVDEQLAWAKAQRRASEPAA